MLSPSLLLLLTTGAGLPALWLGARARHLKRRTVRYLRQSIVETRTWPSPAAPLSVPPADRHGVCLYRDDSEIVESVAELCQAAIGVGDAIMLVVTEEHRTAIEAELGRRGVVLDQHSYLALDADTTLASLLVEGEPDGDRFNDIIGVLVEKLARDRGGLTIYGEMVGRLWDRGQAVAAMTLEGFWNELASRRSFVLLCGYRADPSSRRWALEDVRRAHSHVASVTSNQS